MKAGARQAFTVDVEDYFHVNAFDGYVSREQWAELPSRVERNVDGLLRLLDDHGTSATFFTLGWVAERTPSVPRRIADAGHELASHGWWHRRVVTLHREQFRDEVRRSKRELEDLTGREIRGYRAPSFSLLPHVDWAYDVLLEEGYAYDSSVFPIRRRHYGNPRASRRPHFVERPSGTLLELPMATTELAGIRVPGAGGAYLRILPYALTRRTARRHAERGESGVFYTHPWEIDPEQPRMDVPLLARLRHYTGLSRTLSRLRRLLAEFDFGSIAECYADELAGLGRRGDSVSASVPPASERSGAGL